MTAWLTALLGALLFGMGLVGLLRRRGAPAGLVSPVLLVAGDLLVVMAALALWTDLSTRAVLLVLVAMLPLDAAGAWLLWRRLGVADQDGESDDHQP